MMMLDHQ
jgi:predicted GNAT superfamily acetyltransferase